VPTAEDRGEGEARRPEDRVERPRRDLDPEGRAAQECPGAERMGEDGGQEDPPPGAPGPRTTGDRRPGTAQAGRKARWRQPSRDRAAGERQHDDETETQQAAARIETLLGGEPGQLAGRRAPGQVRGDEEREPEADGRTEDRRRNSPSTSARHDSNVLRDAALRRRPPYGSNRNRPSPIVAT
jgi:hypothetical protein